MILKVQATSSEVLDELGDHLTGGGYAFKPGQISTGADPYNYKYATTETVLVKPNMTVDLASLPAAVRPENDGSAEVLGRPGPAARPREATSVSTPTAPPATPTASRPVTRPTPTPTPSGGSSPPSRSKGGFFGGGGGGGKGGGGSGGKGGGPTGNFAEFGPPEGDRHE